MNTSMIQLILVIIAACIGLAAIIFSFVVAIKIFGGKKNKALKVSKEKPSKGRRAKQEKPVKAEVQKPSGVKFAGTPAVQDTPKPETVNGIRFEDDEEISLKNLEQQVTNFKLDD